jgi:acetyl-CoA carboxylase biotin carboxyl carrier protein
MVMSFSHEDVQRLLQLLDNSHFDELQLEADGIKLSLRRGGSTPSPAKTAAPMVSSATTALIPAAAPAVSATNSNRDTSLLEIRAPMLGAFYGAPKPGAEPFVTVGGRVSTDMVVGIIEVMKLMNSISAGIDGVVVEVLVHDGELVEFDQVLMRVRPE